jgi:hypothetical protein
MNLHFCHAFDSFSLIDLLPKKYNKAGIDANTTTGYFLEPVIGGLDDEHIMAERPTSFGPIIAQPMPTPTVPPSLLRDRNRVNKVRPCLMRHC